MPEVYPVVRAMDGNSGSACDLIEVIKKGRASLLFDLRFFLTQDGAGLVNTLPS